MNFPKHQGLSRSEKENIILNIQQVFPKVISEALIRNVLNKENWDLEKTLRVLHSTLQSYNDIRNTNPKAKIRKNNLEKTSSKNNKKLNTNTQNKVQLFGNAPKTQKKKTKTEEDAGWVVINNPSSNRNVPTGPKIKPKNLKVNMNRTKPTRSDLFAKVQKVKSQNLSHSSLSKQPHLIKSYEIIKLFRDAADRISAYIKEGINVMVLLRGCSGSGKTTYANALLRKAEVKYPPNHIFSTDNFFVHSDGKYIFNSNLLQEAHEWNQKLVRLAASEGRSPIFVDNTNSCLWEMKEYAVIAVKYGYVLETLEPPTPWFFNETILVRKSKHSAPIETIRRMLDRYEANISGEDILRELHLSYLSPMIPPIGTIAGIEAPITKNHPRMHRFSSGSIYNSASCKLNPNSPKPIISIPRTRDLCGSNDRFFNMKHVFREANQSETKEPKSITEKDPVLPLYQISKLSLHDCKSSSQTEFSSSESLSKGSESEEIASSSFSEDENSQHESNFKESSSIFNVCNFEYILITEGNLVIFQKEHEEMKDITTIEQFRSLSDDKPSSFEDYLLNSMQSSCHNKTQPSSGASGDYQTLTSMNLSSVPISESFSNLSMRSKTESASQILNLPNYQDFNADSPCRTEEKNFDMHENIVTSQEIQFSLQSNFVESSFNSSEPVSLPKNRTEPSAMNQELEGATGGKSDVDTLHLLFPKVPKENLLELFGTNFDMDWAVDLLLETGQEMASLTSDLHTHSPCMTREEKQNVSPAVSRVSNFNFSHGLDHERENLPDQLKFGNDDIASSSSNLSKAISPTVNTCRYLHTPHSKSVGKIYSPIDAAPIHTNSPQEIPKSLADWDFKKELPKELTVDLPKIQRTYKPIKRNSCGIDVSTNTNYIDFENLRNLNNDLNTKDVEIKVLYGNNYFISAQAEYAPVPSVLMLEKGTMTTSIETNRVQTISGIERLALMFPAVSKENLEELLEKCHKDIDWAVGLLLDSGHEMSELFTSLEPIDFSEETGESPETVNSNSSPDPSDSPQHNNATKKPRRRKRICHQVNEELQEIKESIENNIVLDESCYSSEKMKKYFLRKNNNNNTGDDTREFQSNINKDISNEITDDQSDSEDSLVFSFDKKLIFELQSRFGGLLQPNMIGDKTFATLPLSLARQLHNHVMNSINDHKKEDLFTDKDEEYARRLQEKQMRSHQAGPSQLEIVDEERVQRKS